MRLPRIGRRHPLALVGLFVLAAALPGGRAAGQDQEASKAGKPRKPAWQWTLDERLAARFDAVGIEARSADDASKREKWIQAFGGESDLRESQPSINGSREPELLLPHELFRTLMTEAFPEDGRPSEMKSRFEEGAVVLGFGSDPWIRLERSAAPYLKLRNQVYRNAMAALARSQSFEEDKSMAQRECRAMTDALAKAQAKFGREPFLRLLYEVVAPVSGVGYSGESDEADSLRSREGGCR